MPTKRFYPNECERLDTESMPCAGGACPTPGGTPSFLSLAPMYALRRRARITGRLPHGRLYKPIDTCCGLSPDTYWEESLPWRASRLCTQFNHNQNILGQYYPKSVFQSLTRCGVLQTKKACACDDIDIDPSLCRPNICEPPRCEPTICEKYTLEPCQYKCQKNSGCDCDCDYDCDRGCECDCTCSKNCGCECDCTCSKNCGCECDCTCSKNCGCECDNGGESDESLSNNNEDDQILNSENSKDENSDDDDQVSNFSDLSDCSECQRQHKKKRCDDECDCGHCPQPCPPPEDPRLQQKEQMQRWKQKRNAFSIGRARAGNPSGRIEPISETMRGAQPYAREKYAFDWRFSRKFQPRHASPVFVGSGNPDAFCNSTRCRFAGSNGPAELRAAICQFGPQSRLSGGAKGCGC